MAILTDEAPGLLEEAWGLIANAGWNAGTGDVELAKTTGWHEAAVRWRDRYHAWIGGHQRSEIADRAESLHTRHHGGVIIASLDTCPRHSRAAYEAMVRGDAG